MFLYKTPGGATEVITMCPGHFQLSSIIWIVLFREFLDLSYNVIEMVEEDAFLTCTSLRELNLEGNTLTLVFALPPSLEIAILKINNFHHWPKFPRGIKYIDLSYNKLSELYDESQVRFDNLEVRLMIKNLA